jgi:hypothetical protein
MDKRTEDDHIHVISVMSLVCGFRNHGFSNIQSFMKSKHLFIYLGRFIFFIKRFLYSSDLHILRKSPPNLRSYVETLSHSSILSEKNSLLYLSSDSLRSIPSYILKRCLYHGYDILACNNSKSIDQLCDHIDYR